MSLGWIWGEKKKDPIKEAEVETINAPELKKDTRVSIRLEVDVNHPVTKGPVGALLDAKINFLLPEGFHIQSCRIQDIDVTS